ncbi:MAG: dienelactone hydrolase family protein, partial [Clostridia bacterium]|nr:dienelactone hydrolase family protein [Clostridia bacterium]
MQTEVAAVFVYPESKSGKVPAVLLLPDPDAKIEQEVLAYFALQGYAVMWFDLCGKKKEETELYTRYPDFLSYANASEATFQLEDVRKTAWFEWIRLSRCALTATLSQPECNGQVAAVAMRKGGELLFPMLATDERLTAGVCMDYPGRSKAPDLSLTKTESVDALRTYYTCVSEDAYAALIEKPLLFLYGTNADHTPPLPDGKQIKYTAEEASEHLNYDWLKRAD